MFIPEKWTPITGAPINPAARARPADFIETGFSPIDGLNTLVRGQKLAGLFGCRPAVQGSRRLDPEELAAGRPVQAVRRGLCRARA